MIIRTIILLVLGCYSAFISAQYNGSGYKVAVIDSGIMNDADSGLLSRIDKQLCYSKVNKLTDDSYGTVGVIDDKVPQNVTFQRRWNHYKQASTCHNGVISDFTFNQAAQVPRTTWHGAPDVDNFRYGLWNHFGATHGSDVANVVKRNASGAKLIIVNNSSYDSNLAPDPNKPDVKCGIHGPDFSIDDDQKPSRDVNCYDSTRAIDQPGVINEITKRGNVAAINYSIGRSINCTVGEDLFRQTVVNKRVAIIAEAGNTDDLVSSGSAWPACNQYVISVGAANVFNKTVYKTNPNTPIDFLPHI